MLKQKENEKYPANQEQEKFENRDVLMAVGERSEEIRGRRYLRVLQEEQPKR